MVAMIADLPRFVKRVRLLLGQEHGEIRHELRDVADEDAQDAHHDLGIECVGVVRNDDIGVDGIKSDIASLKTAVSALSGGGEALAIYQKIEALSSKLEDLTNESNRKLNQYAAYMKKTRTLALAGL